MLLHIVHRTELGYRSRISESVMELRMTPRTDEHQTTRGFAVQVGPQAPLVEHVDWLGNRVHQFSVVSFHETLVIVVESCVDTHPRHPSDEELTKLSDSLPLQVEDHRLTDFLRFHGPIQDDPRLDQLSAALGLDSMRSLGELLSRVATGLGGQLTYKRGVTSSSTAVSRVLDEGGGVCQDFAHVALALLRRMKVPARYISGYLHRADGDPELETHAWVEAFVPSRGWVALDPTHARAVGEQHVAVGVGRHYGDVPPNRGVYRGDSSEQITAVVTIEQVQEVPKGLLSPRVNSLEIPTFPVGPPQHREQLDYQQEQQQQQQQQQ